MDSAYALWTGRALTGVFVLFMLTASIGPKLLGAKVAHDSLAGLGWSPKYLLLIGIIELACVLLYVVPKTSVLGAVLMTALLGGAMATQMRVEKPLFSHVLFSVYLGLFMWGGLWLRDSTLRAMFPFRL